MERGDLKLVVVTLFLIVSVVTAAEDDKTTPGLRCPIKCYDYQCSFHCRRVGYASGKCYQSPYRCSASKGKIVCACYRYRQQPFFGTTLPPVILTASVPTDVSASIAPSSTIGSNAATATPLLSDLVTSTLIGSVSIISTPIVSDIVTSFPVESTSVDSSD